MKQSLIATALLAGLAAGPVLAADTLPDSMPKPNGFPQRPLTMVVPYGAGGGSGQYAGAHAQAFTELTGVSINRDHKPGGSGIIGLRSYMALPADGYNVLEHIDDATSAYASGTSKIDPAADLIPLVTGQITFSQIYIRSTETRFTDWDSFVAFAKSRGGKSTIANVSREGSMERLNLGFVMDHFGFKMQQISFDKGGPRYASLKGGQVDALFEQPGDVRGFLDSGDFKPILTLLKQRPAAFPDTPSMTDVGLTFEPLMRYRGIYVKKGVPEDRLAWLKWAFQKSFYEDSFQAYNEKKFMNLIDSFRDTEGSIALINQTAQIYRDTYERMGLTQ